MEGETGVEQAYNELVESLARLLNEYDSQPEVVVIFRDHEAGVILERLRILMKDHYVRR